MKDQAAVVPITNNRESNQDNFFKARLSECLVMLRLAENELIKAGTKGRVKNMITTFLNSEKDREIIDRLR